MQRTARSHGRRRSRGRSRIGQGRTAIASTIQISPITVGTRNDMKRLGARHTRSHAESADLCGPAQLAETGISPRRLGDAALLAARTDRATGLLAVIVANSCQQRQVGLAPCEARSVL